MLHEDEFGYRKTGGTSTFLLRDNAIFENNYEGRWTGDELEDRDRWLSPLSRPGLYGVVLLLWDCMKSRLFDGGKEKEGVGQ